MYCRKTHDATRGGETEEDSVRSKENGGEILWSRVNSFQVHLLATRAGKHGAKLKPDKQPAEREHEAEDPEHKRGADGPYRPQDRRGCREDTGTDDTAYAT